MQSVKFQTILTFLFIFFSTQLFAVPAADISIQLIQPSGEVFNARAIGDEWNNRMETTKGFTVARDAKGTWRYVTGFGPGKSPIFSLTPANLPAPAGLKKHISKGNARPLGAPGQGNHATSSTELNLAPAQSSTSPVLFILVEFDDQVGETSKESWSDFVGNKVYDFFNKTSHGHANLNPATESSGIVNDGVVGWLNIGTRHPNTAGNTGTINRDLAADAIIAANPFVNFASYDSNSNGYLESEELSVVVIVAGYETSYGGENATSPSVWGHKWGWAFNTAPQVDSVKVLEYAQFGEFHATSLSNKHQATMGIMVHELGHLAYGLPDLYDTDGSSAGIGVFGLMSSGSWGAASSDNWAGQTPVSPSAWVKFVLNWVDDMEGSGVESITASGAGTSADTVFFAATSDTNQYFLVENRQSIGYDRGLERWFGGGFTGGLAIWHIDESKTSNANDSNRLVDLEEADGSQVSYGSTSDLWRQGNGIAFNNNSNPNSKLYNGSDSLVALSSFSLSGTIMSVDFGSAPEPVTPPTEPSITSLINNENGTATLQWQHDGNNLTGFEIQRQKAHKKRANTWTETVSLESASETSRERIDNSGTGTFRYLIRAMNQSSTSSWATSESLAITGDGGGGTEPPQQCPVEGGFAAGASCSSNNECCSGSCKGKPGSKTCK